MTTRMAVGVIIAMIVAAFEPSVADEIPAHRLPSDHWSDVDLLASLRNDLEFGLLIESGPIAVEDLVMAECRCVVWSEPTELPQFGPKDFGLSQENRSQVQNEVANIVPIDSGKGNTGGRWRLDSKSLLFFAIAAVLSIEVFRYVRATGLLGLRPIDYDIESELHARRYRPFGFKLPSRRVLRIGFPRSTPEPWDQSTSS